MTITKYSSLNQYPCFEAGTPPATATDIITVTPTGDGDLSIPAFLRRDAAEATTTPLPSDNRPILEQLAAMVRAELEAVRRAGCSALHHSMNAGDALIAALDRISGNRKAWLAKNCSLSVRSALVYVRLARHRPQIEARIDSLAGEKLSLRGALRLIGSEPPADREHNYRGDHGEHDRGGDDHDQDHHGSKKKKKDNESEAETLVEHWRRSPAELGALLDTAGHEVVLGAMSPNFNIKLQLRVKQPLCLIQQLRGIDNVTAARMLSDAFGASRLATIIEKARELRAPKGGKPGKSGKKFPTMPNGASRH